MEVRIVSPGYSSIQLIAVESCPLMDCTITDIFSSGVAVGNANFGSNNGRNVAVKSNGPVNSGSGIAVGNGNIGNNNGTSLHPTWLPICDISHVMLRHLLCVTGRNTNGAASGNGNFGDGNGSFQNGVGVGNGRGWQNYDPFNSPVF